MVESDVVDVVVGVVFFAFLVADGLGASWYLGWGVGDFRCVGESEGCGGNRIDNTPTSESAGEPARAEDEGFAELREALTVRVRLGGVGGVCGCGEGGGGAVAQTKGSLLGIRR